MHFVGNSNFQCQKSRWSFKVRTPVSIRLRPDPVDCGPLAFHNIFTTRMDSCRPISAAYSTFCIFLLGEDGIVAVNLYQPYQFPIWLPIFNSVDVLVCHGCHNCRARPFDLASSGRTVCEGLGCAKWRTFWREFVFYLWFIYPTFLRVIHHYLFVIFILDAVDKTVAPDIMI